MKTENWNQKLNEEIESMRGRKFEYGEFDCALMVGDCARSMTDIDPVSKYRGEYSSRHGALKIMQNYYPSVEGIDDFCKAICEDLGFIKVEEKFERMGDICLVNVADMEHHDDDYSMGVCLVSSVAVVDREGGIAQLRKNRIIDTWRIPD